jgi:hypothetical protein
MDRLGAQALSGGAEDVWEKLELNSKIHWDQDMPID